MQNVLRRKSTKYIRRSPLQEAFLFRQLLICKSCKRWLIAERQKGHAYYRCHTIICPQKTIREEVVQDTVSALLRNLQPDPAEIGQLEQWLVNRRQRIGQDIAEKRQELLQKLEFARSSLARLTDALISDVIDRAVFVQRKNNLVASELELKQDLANLEMTEQQSFKKLEEAFEFSQSAYLTFMYASYQRRREVITTVAESVEVIGKSVTVKLRTPFETLALHKKNNPDGASN